MDFYKGLSEDKLQGGGKYVKVHGDGGETFNFKPFRAKMYGYVMPMRGGAIRLERLGATRVTTELSDTTVVWTATHPNGGGTYIVGWYLFATVYRFSQSFSVSKANRPKEVRADYHASALESDVCLLAKDARTFRVPRREKGAMGQSNVWYADRKADFVDEVLEYIKPYTESGHPLKLKTSSGVKRAHQVDVLKRMEVETKAVERVANHYIALGYEVVSVEKDNVGWDLTASLGKGTLHLEVKGLSGSVLDFEITPNEFRSLQFNKENYRVCVVTDALNAANLSVFSYSEETDFWSDESENVLKFEERIGARAFVK